MRIQNIVFPEKGVCLDYNLYIRPVGNVEHSPQDGFLHMGENSFVHFDTYFNSFFPFKWKKYTSVSEITLNVSMKGSFRLEIYSKERKENGNCVFNLIEDLEITSKTKKTQKISLGNIAEDRVHLISFSLHSLSNNSIFYGGYYSTDISPEKIRPVKIGLCICTFKREEFVKRNLERIKKNIFENKDPMVQESIEVFVSDNGKTLPENMSEIDEKIHVFSNKNTGGAGGFTRCLIEARKEKWGLTHVLFMDDDIIFDTESLFRTVSLLSLLKDNYAQSTIGGAMLRLDVPNIQVESGAIWNNGNIISLKNGLNLADVEACLFNDIEERTEYNAWWYCAIPIEFAGPDNLPLPIFIRGDDVEYGLRNNRNVILMNGICVWHEPFENKYSSFLYYYILRNRLIDNSVRSIEFSQKSFIDDLFAHWKNEIIRCRYKNATLLLRGVEDFLKGIDWLKNIDGELKHKEIMDAGYKMTPVDQLDGSFMYGQYQDMLNRNDKKKSTKFSILFRSPIHDIAVPAFNPDVNLFYRARNIVNYDYNTRKGFCTRFDRKEVIRQTRHLYKTIRSFKKNYDHIAKEYSERGGELMTLEFWNKYLDINE